MELKDLEEAAHAFADAHLSKYLLELTSGTRQFHRKEINDALWGTIGLTPSEVVIVDSPLLQRLRYIRQLGVVHWIYPGAVHTRFEHTLGVLFQAQHLMTALNAQAETQGGQSLPLLDTGLMQLVRLCALFHDVGHAAFSHVSEMAVETLQPVALLGTQFAESKQIGKRQLSEMFAYYIVGAPAVREMIGILLDRAALGIRLDHDRARNINLIITKISDAIIGIKIDDRLPLLHELISGPFDADKLDYFVRDAKLAGTPSLVDISRLVQKLTIRYLDGSELPPEIGQNVRKIDSKHCLFGMKWSGVAVLDELLLARVLLFAKIYRHPKVSAVEQMLKAAILAIARLVNAERIIHFLYQTPDDVLLNMDGAALAAALKIDADDGNNADAATLTQAASTLRAVRERRLWVRGFQLQRRYPADPREGIEDHRDALILFLEDAEHPQRRQEVLAKIIDEIASIHALTGQPSDRSAIESVVMLHTLGPTPGGAQTARAYLLPRAGKPMPFREYLVNRTAWADGYLSDQPKGFIFAPPSLADAVYVATEKTLCNSYSIKLPASAMEVSKRDSTSIESLKRQLESLGYYEGTSYEIRPVPERLLKADIAPAISKFDVMRAAYQEPQQGPVQSPGLLDEERTWLWLRQFGTDEHISCALKLLASFKMLTRRDTVSALRTFIEANPTFRGCSVVPFGSAKDSGSIHSYFSIDLQGSHIKGCSTLDELARSGAPPMPIVFIDDFVGSGNQARDILAAGFDFAELRVDDLNEQRHIFEDEVQRLLTSVPVAFVFTAAWDAGLDTVSKAAARMGIDATVYGHIRESQIPFAFDCLNGVEQRIVDSFRERCTEIGRELLADKEESKREERALGYGNRAMLLASPFNVPTHTLTAVWREGYCKGLPWSPLFKRRNKA